MSNYREQAIKCPFHEDTHPSMFVNYEKNRAVCYGCAWVGTLQDLVYETNPALR